MKYLLIFIFAISATISTIGQTNTVKISELENKLKRIEKEFQELKTKTITIQDSIDLIKNQISNEKYLSITTNGFICITKNSIQSKLRDNPSAGDNEILIIPKNKSITIIEYVGDDYWKVGYDNLIGYVNEVSLIQTDEMRISIINFDKNKKISDKKQKEEINQLSLRQEKAELERLKKLYGNENAYRISNHVIFLGMTANMAIESIGEPKSINKSTGSWGIHEQWVYDKKFLYFENNVLTSWQEE